MIFNFPEWKLITCQWRYIDTFPFIDFNCTSFTSYLYLTKLSKCDRNNNLDQTIDNLFLIFWLTLTPQMYVNCEDRTVVLYSKTVDCSVKFIHAKNHSSNFNFGIPGIWQLLLCIKNVLTGPYCHVYTVLQLSVYMAYDLYVNLGENYN